MECTPPLRMSPDGGYDLEVKLGELPRPLDFSVLFGRVAPVDIEIGVGSGVFLSTYAQAHPDRDFFGIEKDGAEVKRAKDKCRRRGLTNVRVVQCDANYLLEEMALPDSVDNYHIYFSDPWPKKRHWKRKVFQPRLLPIFERTLRHGGHLYVKTDVTDYHVEILGVLKSAPFLQLMRESRLDLEPREGDIVTNFQRKAIEKGHPIHETLWTRL